MRHEGSSRLMGRPWGNQQASMFLAASGAVSRGAAALTPRVTFRFELQLPPIIHSVPLKAVKRWIASPSASPRKAC